jgi:SAM-dependent methyltransferase
MNSRESWNERYSVSDLVWTDTPNQFVEAHLADLEPGAAIDLGSGEGRNAAWLAGRGWNVTAVDFSPVGLEKARTLASHKGVTVDFVEADALTYQPTELVDLVLISYLQVDQGSQRTVLEHAGAWLVPGGTLFVIAHDRSNVEHGYGGPSSPDVCYTSEETVLALDGLEISTAEVVKRVVTKEDGDRTALDTLVIARRPGGERA